MSSFRISTDAMPTTQRPALLLEEVGRRFTAVDATLIQSLPLRLDMMLIAGTSLSISEFHIAGVHVNRGPMHLTDGDDRITCWICDDGTVRSEHGGHRSVLERGQAVLVTHRLPSQRWWRGSKMMLLDLSREALSGVEVVERACGQTQAANRPILRLLRAYFRSIWVDTVQIGNLGSEPEHNLVALVAGLAAASPEGMRRAAWPALGPARVAAMREIIVRRANEPGLSMRDVAAAVGLGERSGHLTFADQGLTFGGILADARMQRVAQRLRAGDPARIIDIALDGGFGDVAHFNRQFRRHFGMTPGEMRNGR